MSVWVGPAPPGTATAAEEEADERDEEGGEEAEQSRREEPDVLEEEVLPVRGEEGDHLLLLPALHHLTDSLCRQT